MSTAAAVSRALRPLADEIDRNLELVAGERIGFSLLVWTEGRAQYVSNSSRPECIQAMKELLARWDEGMPDIPAHEVS